MQSSKKKRYNHQFGSGFLTPEKRPPKISQGDISTSLYEGKTLATIRIPVRDNKKFLEYIGEYPTELKSIFRKKMGTDLWRWIKNC